MWYKKTLSFFVLFLISTHAFASIVITNGLTHHYKVKSGTIQKGIVTIQNTADTPQEVKLYQRDYRYDATGASYYEEYGTNERSNLKWIQLNTNQIKIAGKSKVDVMYEITVPDILPDGSSWSVIMVEPIEPLVPSDDKQGIHLRTVIRYSIQIITTNEKPAKALLNFDKIDLNKQDGKTVLQLAIANNGELYHLIEASIELFNSTNGNRLGIFKSDKVSLLPNNSKSVTIDLNSIPPGTYQATVLANTKDDGVFGINVELNVPNE